MPRVSERGRERAPRFAAVYLPWVRVELARSRMAREEQPLPLAIVIARPGGAVKDERSLLGNTKLDEVSKEALACGVRAGMTIAAARAKSADLRVRVVAMDAVTEVLVRVAEAGLAFGATTSFDVAADVACVDVTGCAHLHDGGEAELAAKLDERVRAMGHACRVALADGPRVAMAAARFFPRRGDGSSHQVIVPRGGNAMAMSVMPLDALPLDGEARAWLSKLGVKRCGDLQKLPRASLGTRLGGDAAAVMAILRGEDGAPLTPYVPPEVPEERAELEYGIGGTEPLLFVVKMLCDRLSARLQGRAMAAARLELELSLDRAMLRDSSQPATATLAIAMPAPLGASAELLAVLRARVESYAIAAPILAVTLRAPSLARKDARSLDLFLAEARADRALPRLAAELSADLGDERVGTLALADTWSPEGRTRLAPYSPTSHSPPAPLASLLTAAPEPARIIAAPLACASVRGVKLLARVEASEWWRHGVTSRDYLAGWSDGERAMAWIELDRASGAAVIKGWMD